jgi:hypothetical protein
MNPSYASKVSKLIMGTLVELSEGVGVNFAPNKPNIEGPSNGKINKLYNYEIVSYDPDGDNLSYYIEFEDSEGFWTDYYPSGLKINESWTWSEKGDYLIKVKAKDIFGAESDWSTLTISMPRGIFNQDIFNNYNGLFLIKNVLSLIKKNIILI